MADKKNKKKQNKSAGKSKEPAKKKQEPVQPLPFEQAYEAGNFAAAHRLAGAALEGEHAKRANEVLGRISVDKVPLLVFAGCLVFISIIAALGL